ncbi:MAG TPA: hypothetical protein DF613_03995 [Lachnospiraceae bacterium]|nr:hypothetical protein [Lachnospiraceae bacterium]
MKINGWDVSCAGAKQCNVTFGNHGISSASEWIRASPVPVFFRNDIGFKSLKIVLLIKKKGGRETLLRARSEILSRLLEPVEIVLDNYANCFYGILEKHSAQENVMRRWHTLTLELNCYECGRQVTESFTETDQVTVTNMGNLVTPAVIEVTPLSGTATLSVTGICRDADTGENLPVVLKNLKTGKTVTIDGETGLITEDGALKAGDTEIWALPTLLPGDNRIILDNKWMELTVKFRPRFM